MGRQVLSLEAWGTVASVATLFVITATAVAALAQMRHARSSNQIAAVTEMRETMESEAFRQARRSLPALVHKLIHDPVARKSLAGEDFPAEFEAVREVARFFETMGAFTKFGIVDRSLICDLWDGIVFRTWKQLEPVIMIRRTVYYTGFCSNFEYLAVICQRSLFKSHGDYYPRGMPRMVKDQQSIDAVSAFARDQEDAREAGNEKSTIL